MDHTVVGQPVAQLSARERVTGRAMYAGDLKRPGMLHARILRSPLPHARILRIDTAAAAALPGVHCVVTGADVPATKWGVAHKQQHVLARGLVRFVGEEVAAVVATTEAIAARALELIEVDYDPLPALLDPALALDPDAPLVHAGGNLAHEIRVGRGDVEAGFAVADLVH